MKKCIVDAPETAKYGLDPMQKSTNRRVLRGIKPHIARLETRLASVCKKSRCRAHVGLLSIT
jgi:hypothetical protein